MVNETKNAVVPRSMTGAQNSEPRISSIEIAQLTEKQHKHVMEAIRKMESTWEKVQGSKFRLSSRIYNLPNGGTKEVPCYDLTKTETLFIATKFNDEARARLVLRWEELERERMRRTASKQLLLETEEEIKQRCDCIRHQEIGDANAPADDCMTASEVARMLGKSVKELNKQLVAKRVQYWKDGSYHLRSEYLGRGLTRQRAYHYYGLDGTKKECEYMVWTKLGAEMIVSMIG